MSILHDAYTALLAGLTYRTGNEIHWQDEENNPIAIEHIDAENERYIVRGYYSNGQKNLEAEYQNGQRHGKSLGWYPNGQKWWEIERQNDKQHGKSIGWHRNGQKSWEEDHQNGQLYGKRVLWDDCGKKILEEEYQNGVFIGKIL
jgi:antitoxin component YwqK of YwqJK toxin-antitoxin module